MKGPVSKSGDQHQPIISQDSKTNVSFINQYPGYMISILASVLPVRNDVTLSSVIEVAANRMISIAT